METNPYELVARWLSTDTAPAWVQAIGSIAAILAAILVIYRQHELDLARDIAAEGREERGQLRAADAIAAAIHERTTFLQDEIKNESKKDETVTVLAYLQYAGGEFTALREIALRANLSSVQSGLVINAWASMLGHMARLDASIRGTTAIVERAYAAGHEKFREDRLSRFGERMTEVRAAAEHFRELIENA